MTDHVLAVETAHRTLCFPMAEIRLEGNNLVVSRDDKDIAIFSEDGYLYAFYAKKEG